MRGGEISGNTAESQFSGEGDGGGVIVQDNGTFNMKGGEIFGNSALGFSSGWERGGGVFNHRGGTFQISNGIIHGSHAAEHLRNTAYHRSRNAALYSAGTWMGQPGGTSRFGTFDNAGRFTELGTLRTTSGTIHVVEGELQLPQEYDLLNQFAWVRELGQDGGEYTFELSGDETIAPQSLNWTGINDVTIILRGSVPSTLSLSETRGSLFSIGSGFTLVLDDNITLQGRDDNNTSLVEVGGTLVMNEGARITGNTGLGGRGVRVNSGGVFILDGGEISGNSTTDTGWQATAPGQGGGVRVESGGRFDMLLGTISGNTGQNGGGVFVANNGIFQISNGIIHGSDAEEELPNVARGNGASLHGTDRHVRQRR